MKNVLFLTLLTAVAASADPSIGAGGVLNAASNAFQGLPNSAIAQGSIFVVYGTGMGPAPTPGSAVTSASFPLPTVLPMPDGTSVNITVGGTTVQAFMIYTSPQQLAAVLPSNTPVGTGTITVSYQGKTSASQPITVAANSVGIFTLNQAGSGPAVVQNFVSNTSVPVNTLTTPAHAGQTGILYATGLGPVTFDESKAAQSGDVGASDFQLTVGGKVAQVAYHGRSSCCAGLDQINFIVPDGVDGCYVSVSVRDGGVYSNISSIAVGPSGQPCSDPTGFSASSLQKINQGGTLSYGGISISHSTSDTPSFPTGVPGSQQRAIVRAASGGKKDATNSSDFASAVFFKWDTSVLKSQGFSQPSIGSCSVNIAKGQSAATDPILPTPLNAGNSVEVKGGPSGATVVLEKSLPGIYGAQAPAGFVGAGTFTADNGSGGPDVPGFNVSASFGAPLVWSNKSSITDVTRSAGQLITWTGGATGTYVTISGASFAVTSEFDFLAAAYFVCLAPVEAQQFTVPAWVLETLPTSPASGIAGLSLGSLAVSNYSYTQVTIAPLDEAFFTDSSTDSKSVNYK